MDRADAVDDFADPARKLASGELPFAPEPINLLRIRGMSTTWMADNHGGDKAEPDVLHHDEQHGRQRLAAEQGRLHEGIADEAAQRLHLVLHHGRHFGGFHPLEVMRRKPQDAIDEIETDTPQHAFAEAALVGVDVEFEQAVDDDQQEEHKAQGKQRRRAVELKTGEELDLTNERQVIVVAS